MKDFCVHVMTGLCLFVATTLVGCSAQTDDAETTEAITIEDTAPTEPNEVTVGEVQTEEATIEDE